MATDLLSGLGAEVFGALTGGAREALPFIIGGVSQGLSANSIQSALQAGGIGIRRSNLLTLVNAYRGIFQVAQVQAGLPPEEILPSSIFLPSATFMKKHLRLCDIGDGAEQCHRALVHAPYHHLNSQRAF